MTEEQKIKCEEIINSCEEKYNKGIDEIKGKSISRNDIARNTIYHLFHSHFYRYEIVNLSDYRFLRKCKKEAIEDIVELSVSLAKVFNINTTKEEAKCILFRNNMRFIFKDDIIASLRFEDMVEAKIESYDRSDEGMHEPSDFNIKNIGWAIADYIDFNNNFKPRSIDFGFDW